MSSTKKQRDASGFCIAVSSKFTAWWKRIAKHSQIVFPVIHGANHDEFASDDTALARLFGPESDRNLLLILLEGRNCHRQGTAPARPDAPRFSWTVTFSSAKLQRARIAGRVAQLNNQFVVARAHFAQLVTPYGSADTCFPLVGAQRCQAQKEACEDPALRRRRLPPDEVINRQQNQRADQRHDEAC